MACRVLPPRSVHPLAAILLPHNGLLVGGKNYQGAKTRGRQGCRKRERKREIKRWREREGEKEMEKAVSGCAAELSYSCYDLSSLKSISLSSFSFFVSPHSLSPSGLWVVFIFLMSRWFFFFCFSSLLHSFWMEGNICHTVKPVFASSECVWLCLWTAEGLSGVKCLHHGFGWRWWQKWTQRSE